MKKQIVFYAFLLAVSALLSNSTVFAQEDEQHVFVVVTWKTVMPEDGSAAERDSLLMEMTEAVDNKNEHILSTLHLRHFYGSDSRDWVIITEYKNWGDIEAATKRSQELINQHWSDKNKQAEFFKKISKYFSGHSDEIFAEISQFKK